jgi:thiamine biosynthesis lipoprotein
MESPTRWSAAGDIVAGDAPPGLEGWKVGIASLQKPNAEPTRFLTLKNAAVSTSGDAYQATVVDGVRYSHIVDPKTGMGITRQCSVTVLVTDGTYADGLASTMIVLGPERGLKFIETRKGAEALFVEMHDGNVREFQTPGFPPAVGK